MPSIVNIDEHGDLIIDGRVSIQSWERELQLALVQYAVNAGDVVMEVGYGLGMASKAIFERRVLQHWIVESHPEVLNENLGFIRDRYTGVLLAPWQELFALINDSSIDALVFDPDPPPSKQFAGTLDDTLAFVSDALQSVARILRKSGRMTFLDFSAQLNRCTSFLEQVESLGLKANLFPMRINPPCRCTYAKAGLIHITQLTRV
jgi:predicted methyltransferase